MKILQLDLIAFGPFTNTKLDWSGGSSGLHIVYGANEAGKTSALRALHAFLFGIPVRTDDDFIHDKRKLRIGATLRLENGETHSLLRLKKNKDSLRRADDEQPVEESLLRQMLGGVDEHAFTAQFGIDYAKLTAGGQAVLEGQGDMGKMLFSAATGMPQVLQVLATLNEEAKALFAPTARKSVVNQLIQEYKTQREKVKAAQTPSKSWQAMSDAFKKLETERRRLSQKIAEREIDLEDLQRIIQAEQDLNDWPRVQAELKALGNTPRLSADFSKQRKAIERNLVEENEAKRSSQQRLQVIKADLLSSTPDEKILALADQVDELKNRNGAILKAVEDRPSLEQQRSRLIAEMQEIAADVGPAEWSSGANENRAGATATRAAIEELSRQHGALAVAVKKSRQRIKEMEARIARNRQRLHDLPSPKNAEPLRQSIKKSLAAGDLEGRLATAAKEALQLQHKAQNALKKLHPWQGGVDTIERLPLPNPETVARLSAACEQSEKELAAIEREQQKNAQTLAEKRADLESLRIRGDVPTEEDLAEARRRRDEGWRLIVQGDGTNAEELAAFVDAIDLVDANAAETALFAAYEHCVRRADAIADRLRREAQEVAKKAYVLAELEQCEQQAKQLGGHIAAAQQKTREHQDAWKAFWEEIGAPILPPQEMRSWLAQRDVVLRHVADFREKQREQERLQEQAAKQCAQLREAMSSLQQETTLGGRNEVLEICQTVVSEIECNAEERRKIEHDLKRDAAEAVQEKEEANAAEAALAQWRTEWELLMPQINLPAAASPAQALAVMRRLEEYESRGKEAAALCARMQNIDRDIDQFAQNVAEVVHAIGDDASDRSPHQTLALLAERSDEAKKQAAVHQKLQAQWVEENRRLAKANAKIGKLESRRNALRREAKCGPDDDLEEIESQDRQFLELEEKCQGLTRRLASAARGVALDVFAAREQQRDFKQARTEEKALASEIELSRKSLKELDQNVGTARADLNRIDDSGQAAHADEEAQRILANLRQETRQYLRTKVASLVLDEALARHRKKNEKGPVVRRAEALFRQLTRGSFVGLNTNDAGSELVGQRSAGADALGIEQMSTGACDQLYLALRLAGLEHRLQAGPKLPFIVDDILIQFDDARVVAALQVLAELSQQTQVILFTHHEHLVRLAQENLPADVLFTQTLGTLIDLPQPAGSSQKELFTG